MISYEKVHEMSHRATPSDFLLYRQSLLLFSVFNEKGPVAEWIGLNEQQLFLQRDQKFKIAKTNRLKIGNNIPVNRFSVLNGLIQLNWLNLSREAFKLKIKNIFLK